MTDVNLCHYIELKSPLRYILHYDDEYVGIEREGIIDYTLDNLFKLEQCRKERYVGVGFECKTFSRVKEFDFEWRFTQNTTHSIMLLLMFLSDIKNNLGKLWNPIK